MADVDEKEKAEKIAAARKKVIARAANACILPR